MRSSRPDQSLTGDLTACLARSKRGRQLQRELLMAEAYAQSDLSQPLIDAVRLFESLDIPYALIGGLAAMYYGRPRFTEDVDFIAETGHQSILDTHAEAMKTHRFDPSCTWKLYHRSGAEIDLWKDEHVDAMIKRAETVTLASVPVKIVAVHDLIAMKLRSHRLQDDYDISEILKSQTINRDRVAPLVSNEQLKHFDSIRARSTE